MLVPTHSCYTEKNQFSYFVSEVSIFTDITALKDETGNYVDFELSFRLGLFAIKIPSKSLKVIGGNMKNLVKEVKKDIWCGMTSLRSLW